ncbi:MAG: translation elongation factor 4 [Patescibacteria group bacterium]
MENKIRNFCIIAHIDHGKSTLADRMLEITQTVSKRDMKNQMLDQMDLERERGITIKLQPATMKWKGYILNLIDTPGHVDFSYEVSRSLAAVEGAVLLVDATQGIQAQTLSNLYLAMEQNLTLIPVINKIDLFNAQTEKVVAELAELIGCEPESVIQISAKTGKNVEAVLEAVIEKVPPAKIEIEKPARALIFDSKFDEYKGVLAYIRVVEGEFKSNSRLIMLATGKEVEAIEIGIFHPELVKRDSLSSGEIGYIATGLKDVSFCRVGDTIALAKDKLVVEHLAGYKEVKPMVFAGIYCKEGSDFGKLKEALDKLSLTDASLVFQQESSVALGPGFRCGFLGLLHLDIVQERLRREYNLDLIITSPTVAYNIYKRNGEMIVIHSPQELIKREEIESTKEPWMRVEIVTPEEYIGSIMKLIQDKRGQYKDMVYFSQKLSTFAKNVIINAEIPLTSLVSDFYDALKGVSSGFASMNYEFLEYRQAEIRKVDILVAGDLFESLSAIAYEDNATSVGRKIIEALKNNLSRQMFEIKLQATIGGKIIASERIPAMRKDVIAKLYGGDVTRKRKLLEKQKKGKKKMQSQGNVDIPADVYLKILKK